MIVSPTLFFLGCSTDTDDDFNWRDFAIEGIYVGSSIGGGNVNIDLRSIIRNVEFGINSFTFTYARRDNFGHVLPTNRLSFVSGHWELVDTLEWYSSREKILRLTVHTSNFYNQHNHQNPWPSFYTEIFPGDILYISLTNSNPYTRRVFINADWLSTMHMDNIHRTL